MKAQEGYIATNSKTGEQIILQGGKWVPYVSPTADTPSETPSTTGVPNLESQLRGLTVGLSDPLIAAGRAGLGAVTGGLPFGQGFADERANLAARKQQQGGLGTAQEIAGGMLSGGATAKMLPAAMKAKPYLSSMLIGAGTGGTYSATQGENPAVGGAIGSVAGPAGQALGTGIGKALSPVARTIMNRGSQQRSSELLRRDVLEPGQMSIQDVSDEMTKRGPGTLPIEAMGEAGTRSGMAASQASTGAKQQIRTAVDKRLAGKWPRLRNDVKRLMGGKSGEKFYKSVDDVVIRRRKEAKPLYEKAFKDVVEEDNINALAGRWDSYVTNGIPDINFPALSGSPRLKSTVKSAVKSLEKGEGFKAKVGDLDLVQRELMAKSKAFRRTGQDDKALVMDILRKDLLDITDQASPAYQQARKVYRDESAIIDAMKLGRSILRDDAEVTEQALKSMSQSEHDAYLLGAAKSLRDATATKTPGFFTRNPLVQERLAHAFPDKKSLDEFLDISLTREARISELSSKVLHGSMTAEKTMAQRTGVAMAAKEALTGEIGSLTTRVVSAISGTLGRKYPPQVADELAKTLLAEGPEEFAKRASLRLDPEDVSTLVRTVGGAGAVGTTLGAQP